jgi:hypothetical protein
MTRSTRKNLLKQWIPTPFNPRRDAGGEERDINGGGRQGAAAAALGHVQSVGRGTTGIEGRSMDRTGRQAAWARLVGGSKAGLQGTGGHVVRVSTSISGCRWAAPLTAVGTASKQPPAATGHINY